MKEDNGGRTLAYASLRHHQKKRRVPIDDWESYLYTLCDLIKIPLDWFTRDMTTAAMRDKKAASTLFGELKSNRTKILVSTYSFFQMNDINQMDRIDFRLQETIEQKLRTNAILKNVLLAFAEEVFSGKETPDYDGLDKLVTDNLAQYYADQTCFSWISHRQDANCSIRKRIKESIKRANTKIGDLVIPTNFSEYDNFHYPDVDEGFFSKQSNWFFGCY